MKLLNSFFCTSLRKHDDDTFRWQARALSVQWKCKKRWRGKRKTISRMAWGRQRVEWAKFIWPLMMIFIFTHRLRADLTHPLSRNGGLLRQFRSRVHIHSIIKKYFYSPFWTKTQRPWSESNKTVTDLLCPSNRALCCLARQSKAIALHLLIVSRAFGHTRGGILLWSMPSSLSFWH